MHTKFLNLLKSIINHFPKKHIYYISLGLIILISLLVLSELNLEVPKEGIKELSEKPLEVLRNEVLQEEILPVYKETNIKKNDSLFSILKRAGVKESNIFQIINSENSKLLTKIKINKTIKLSLSQDNEVIALDYVKDFKSGVEVKRKGEAYIINEYLHKTEKFKVFKEVIINDSLYLDGLRQGLPDSVIMDLVYIFGWDIDFVHDIRPGDSYSLIYEEVFVDGEKVLNGDILIAEFSNLNKNHIAIRYQLDSGASEYFSPQGRNVKKAFLRSPLKFSYISSKYNLKRRHPILHKIKAHTGVDYAAQKGTPVRATGEGIIVHASMKGGYGNLIEIKHTEDYSTRYAHLEKFHPGIKIGKRVKQADIVGYVGKTGTATGYHLHYEFRVNMKHTNPLTVKFPNANPIKPSEKNKYEFFSRNILSELRNYQNLSH